MQNFSSACGDRIEIACGLSLPTPPPPPPPPATTTNRLIPLLASDLKCLILTLLPTPQAIQQLNKMGNSSNQTSSLSTTTVTLFDLKEIENELLRRISDIGQEMEVIRKHINDELGVKVRG